MILIRKAVVKDAAKISYIQRESWHDTYCNIISQDFLNKFKVGDNASHWIKILNRPANNAIMLLYDHLEVGFASWGPCRNSNVQEYSTELYAIYILKSYRGKNIGTKALEFIKNETVDKMIVWVLKENPFAGFYNKIGKRTRYERKIEIGKNTYNEISFEI